MTSSSASGSTWRTLYGSNGSAIARRQADGLEGGRQRLGLVRAEPPEEVANDIAERGGHRQRQDGAEQPRQRSADDDREHDRGRVQFDRLALDPRHQEVVLDLLDQRVQEER